MILILEDCEERIEWFLGTFPNQPIMHTLNPEIAISNLKDFTYATIFLDHDLLPEHEDVDLMEDNSTGWRVATWLAGNPENNKEAKIIIHTMNSDAGLRMEKILEKRGAKYVPYRTLKDEK